MTALKQYFDTDFNSAIRLHVSLRFRDADIEAALLYEMAAANSFMICYLTGPQRPYEEFVELLRTLEYGRTQLNFRNLVTLPSAKQFPGELRFDNRPGEFRVEYRLFGDPIWRDIKELESTRRVFLYSEADLCDEDIVRLQNEAKRLGHNLQFRAKRYMEGRMRFEKPLAFISHDSRDKDSVARPIAITLQKMLCPVWYDEFALKVGDRLRESIEKGLKECKKCILILSPHFLSNNGWTKREFNSIFTREILEEAQLVLPIWCGVTKEQIYDYSPSLLDVKAAIWDEAKLEDICRQLNRVITE